MAFPILKSNKHTSHETSLAKSCRMRIYNDSKAIKENFAKSQGFEIFLSTIFKISSVEFWLNYKNKTIYDIIKDYYKGNIK